MTQLSDIPVKVEMGPPKENNLAITHDVLHQVKAALAEWLDTGQSGAVDLKNFSRMDPKTYQYLKDALSTGEVTVVIEAMARVEIKETQFPGVWWVTHINDLGDVVTEIIEITEIPAILKPHVVEVREGLQRLERLLATVGNLGTPVSLD